ncbi:MAG: UbiA family prenyltransferase [Planctomycetes bacterium]|nr:UbiA family prenyltransferase [Planctomycetota bacterium]
MSVLGSLSATLRMIRFSHTVFALPFALLAAIAAARRTGDAAGALWRCGGWVLLCMVAARSAAMTFNRLADARWDAANPRTRGRELVTGTVTPRFAALFFLATSSLFVFSAAMLNDLAGMLAVPALAILCLYSYTKRFTALSHLALGACLGMAPVGAWIGVLGAPAAFPLWLGAAVLCWAAGFDILYAIADVEFDLSHGLFSLPASLGVRGALWVSAALHAVTAAILAAIGLWFHLGPFYFAGLVLVAGLLLYEHWILRPGDLSRLGAAFFTVNGAVSLVFGGASIADLFLSGATP